VIAKNFVEGKDGLSAKDDGGCDVDFGPFSTSVSDGLPLDSHILRFQGD